MTWKTVAREAMRGWALHRGEAQAGDGEEPEAEGWGSPEQKREDGGDGRGACREGKERREGKGRE